VGKAADRVGRVAEMPGVPPHSGEANMVSYIHLPIVALCSFILLAIWRLWVCIDRLGFLREVSRRAPTMFHGHLLAALLAIIDTADAVLPLIVTYRRGLHLA